MAMYLGDQKVRITDKSKTNLLDVFNRTEGKLTSGYSNTSIRPELLDETKYFVGLSYNNYYRSSNITKLIINKNVSIESASTNGAYGVGFPVKCKPNTDYILSTNIVTGPGNVSNFMGISYFKEDGTWVKKEDGSELWKSNSKGYNYVYLKSPNECDYILVVLCPGKDSITTVYKDICLVEGYFNKMTFTGYEPYNLKLTPPIIKVTSKNMFNPNGEYYEDRYVSSLYSHKIEKKNTYRTYKIRVKPNTNYAISFLTENNLYYGFSNSIKIGSNVEGYSVKNESKVVNSGNNVYLCFSIWKASVDNLISYIQIEEGDIATEYEPYTSEIHYEY